MKTINLFLLFFVFLLTFNCKKTDSNPDYANLVAGRQYTIEAAGVGKISQPKTDFTVNVSKQGENLVLLTITRKGNTIIDTKCKIKQDGDWYVVDKTYTPTSNDIRWSTFTSYTYSDGRKFNQFRFEGFDNYLNQIGVTASYFGQ